MKKTDRLRARGFSLGTKLILITALIETLTIGVGLFNVYHFLVDQRMSHYKQILVSQSDLIAKEVELNKDHPENFSFDQFDLGTFAAFQILDMDGKVIWDSKDPKRNQTFVLSQHRLFSIAKKSTQKRATVDYQSAQTEERYLGAFRRVLDHYLILGAVAKDDIDFEINRNLERFLYFAVLMCGLSFIIIVLYTHHFISPIRTLTAASRKIAQGDFEVEIAKPSGDEIGMLSESFNVMVKRVRVLLEGEVQKIRIEKEVGGVAELQQHLMPPSSVKNPRFEIESHYESATETGGDYWGFIETETHLLVYVGDATGHGLPSAMMTAAARGCFSALQHLYRTTQSLEPSPANFLEFVNQAVLDVSRGELQMTMFVAVYSFKDQKLRFANAGHNPAWIARAESPTRIETLLSRGPRLGESTVLEKIKEHEVDFGKNDVLFLHSDGLLDCMNEEGVALGKNRIKDLILTKLDSKVTIAQTRDGIVGLVREQTAGSPPHDDITFSLLRFFS